MTKIYLVRHAEAEGNLYRRIQGHYDGDITPRGYKQIELLAERFRSVDIDAVYASDLKRTQKTAGSVLKYHRLPLNIEPGLKEVDMGAWEDKPWGNVAYDEPDQMFNFSYDPVKWDIAGGEAFNALKKRLWDTVCGIAEKHEGQTVACFSHGMAIRSLISEIKGVSSENIHDILHGDNTCVASLSFEGGRLGVEYYNDNSHLPTELSTFAGQEWWKSKNKIDFSNLRIIPMNIVDNAKLYSECYRDAWVIAHGTARGFSDEPYLQGAERASKKNPLSLMKAYFGDEFAGIIELDPDRMADENAGWISFIYLTPDYRSHGMGVQLIGHAVSVYRALGRGSLRLLVAQDNTNALAFYNKLGFRHIGTQIGNLCPLRLMEMKL